MTLPQSHPPAPQNHPAITPAAPAAAPQSASPLTWRYPFPARDGKEAADPQVFYSALGAMSDGFFPLGVNGFPHGGVHFGPASASRLEQSKGVRVIADGDIVAFKLDDAYPHLLFSQDRRWSMYSTGFVLVRHQMTMPAAPGSNAAQPADETLTFFSLYLHMADWSTYLSDSKLVRPGWWPGVDAFRIGAKDTQNGGGASGAFVYTAPTVGKNKSRYIKGERVGFLPEGSEITISETRGPWGHIKEITAGNMVSPTSGGVFGSDDLNVPWVHPDDDTTGTAPVTPENDWGWIYLHDQQAVKEPIGVGTVITPSGTTPIQVKAGTLLGQLGEYIDYETSTPLPPVPSRQLLHLEVFADETLKSFIEKSRARATQLPVSDRTILVIQAGAKLVAKPTDADLYLGAAVQLAKLTLTSTSPKTGPWVHVQPWINGAGHAQQYQNPVWIARSGLSRLDSPNGLPAWKSFPLQLSQVGSPVNADLVAYPSTELDSLGDGNVAVDDKGVTWWRLELGTGSGQTASGWVCGAKLGSSATHPGTHWESPWAWPGFEIVDATGINLTDAFKRNLSVTGSANPKEQKAFAPSTEAVGNSALLSKLEQTVSRLPSSRGVKDERGKDGSVIVTAVKLRQALGRRWLASDLCHVILKYESEWGGGMNRWEALTPLMRNAAENWKCELERIKKLQWWDSVKDKVEGFPSSPVVNHIHPVALIGNFLRYGFRFTLEMVQHIFPTATVATLQVVIDELNTNIELFKLDTSLRREHFFAQVRREAGPSLAVHDGESLNYPPSRLIQKFSYFQQHPNEAEQYGRTSAHSADQEAIANRAYGGRNGNVQNGDGWNYRGRGLIQITGRAQYGKFSAWHRQNSHGWPNEANLDFLDDFQLVGQIKYATRSAAAYWVDNQMYQIADEGTSSNVVDNITKVINPGLFSHRLGQPINAENMADIVDRQNNFSAIHSWQGLK
ncbi:glycoside hydrolase family 19 protein [Paraburkholderia sp. GAS82]|uniref:glycoside hydrolase family 19 protein n=1 Tax=Paraburkholderia sp. GAS82 TaxID=3035137 RepID=UPI003D21B488